MQSEVVRPPSAPPPRVAALPLTWALKASVAAICIISVTVLISGRCRKPSPFSAVPWLLFFLGTAISSGLYSAVEARPALDEVAPLVTLELCAVNLSAVGAWLAGGQLLNMSGCFRPVRAAYTALGFHLSASLLLIGLNIAVFTSEPASSRLDLALSLASLGALGLIAGAIAGLVSPSRRAAPLRLPSGLVLVGVSFTGIGFAVCEGWLGPACAVAARCPLPHGLEPEAVEHASLAASCIVLGTAACLLLLQRGGSGGSASPLATQRTRRRAELREQLLCNTEAAATVGAPSGAGAAPLGRAWLECGVCGGRCLLFRSECCSRCGFGCCPWCLDDDKAAPLAKGDDTAAEPTCFVCRLQERALDASSTASSADADGKPASAVDCETPPPAPPLPPPPERFVVIGAGIVGSFCALELARRGFAVDVVDSAEGAGTWRGIINLNAQGVALTRRASEALAEGVRKEHQVARSATFWDATLERPILTYDLATEGRRYGLPEEMITCERRRFLEQLREAAQAAGARLRLGCAVERVVEQEDTAEGGGGGVVVHLADGSCVRSDYVIACDGVRSSVRTSLFAHVGGADAPRATGHYACGGIARGVDLPSAASTDQTELWGAAGCFLVFRYTGGVTFWAALRPGTRPPHPKDEPRESYQRRLLADAAQAFHGYHPVVRSLLDATELESVGCFELHDVRLTQWSVGRVMLLGDAAHAMCNRLGSGGCTGMEDASVAADLIDLCLRANVGGGSRHQSILEAFRLTQRRRKPRARRVQLESYMLALTTVNLAESGALRAMRDAALRWIGGRSERWRLPIFDFLNNYRVGCERGLLDVF